MPHANERARGGTGRATKSVRPPFPVWTLPGKNSRLPPATPPAATQARLTEAASSYLRGRSLYEGGEAGDTRNRPNFVEMGEKKRGEAAGLGNLLFCVAGIYSAYLTQVRAVKGSRSACPAVVRKRLPLKHSESIFLLPFHTGRATGEALHQALRARQ